jgi:transposase
LVIKWGKQNNKQRFKCKDCGQLFLWRNDKSRQARGFVWFRRWVLERQTYRLLSHISGQSERSLKRKFNAYLAQAPTVPIKSKTRSHLLIDGTYYTNGLCLVLYQDHDIKYSQLYRFTDRERNEEICEDLENLKKLGVDLESVTCDGHRAIIKAVRKIFPQTIVQRCLVHIQRMGLIWLTERPKTEAARQLRELVKALHLIQTQEQRTLWLWRLYLWDKEHKAFLSEYVINPLTGRKWYKHRRVRSVRFLIIQALPNMFHYLNNPLIPKSTNSIEAFFKHLKLHLQVHGGLTLKHRKEFIKWYLFFRTEQR